MCFKKAPANKKVGFRPLVWPDTYNFYFSGYWGKGKAANWTQVGVGQIVFGFQMAG